MFLKLLENLIKIYNKICSIIETTSLRILMLYLHFVNPKTLIMIEINIFYLLKLFKFVISIKFLKNQFKIIMRKKFYLF